MSLVVEGALLMCDMGVAPSPFSPTPHMVSAGELPAGNIMDFAPMENIATFGMCMSPANPEVASATAAALGVLTPMPCIPATMAPWVPGSTSVMIDEMPALTETCTCQCMWGGTITVSFPGQVFVQATS